VYVVDVTAKQPRYCAQAPRRQRSRLVARSHSAWASFVHAKLVEREEQMSLTCFLQYDIDPTKKHHFETYARNWGQAIPRCGVDLIGYYAPHEGSTTLAYGVYNVASLADYEAYRARLAADPLGKENYEFAMSEKFIRSETRTFLKLASGPHGTFNGELIKP